MRISGVKIIYGFFLIFYTIVTLIFLIYLGKYICNLYIKKISEKDNKYIGLKISSFIYLISSCIMYNQDLGGYVLIPIGILLISFIFRFVKLIKTSKVLYLLSSIAFIVYSICVGTSIWIEDAEILFRKVVPPTHIYNNDEYLSGWNFNSKFSQYEGENKTGSRVKSLIQEVTLSNSSLRGERRKIKLIINDVIEIDGTEVPDELQIDNFKKYNTSFERDDEGLICLGRIEEVK